VATAQPAGDWNELDFLRAYEESTLWKPQVVADNVLNGIFLADAAHRALLAALMVQEVAEAARRLNHVWIALTDRSVSVGRRLAGPLPGADDWDRLATTLETIEEPAQVLGLLNLDESVLDSVEELLDYRPLHLFTSAVRVAEAGPPNATIEPAHPPVLVLSNIDPRGERYEARIELADDRVIALGDATGDFVTWARDFLGAYLDARGA
jgi:hypothetical protein